MSDFKSAALVATDPSQMRSLRILGDLSMDGKIGSGLAILMVSALLLMTSCDKKFRRKRRCPQTSSDASASKTAPQQAYWKTFIAETAEEEGKVRRPILQDLDWSPILHDSRSARYRRSGNCGAFGRGPANYRSRNFPIGGGSQFVFFVRKKLTFSVMGQLR